MSRKLLNRRTYTLLSAVVVLAIALGQHFGWLGAVAEQAMESQPGLYSIDRFIDGDTIAVKMGDTSETIRMIGIDTPETHKPNTPVQCYGPAAAAFTKQTIGSNSVRLESDPQSQNRDRYDRLLRYVYLPDGRLIQKLLVEQGYAFVYEQFPFSKSTDFLAAQTKAQASKSGLWGNCRPVKADNGRWQSNKAE